MEVADANESSVIGRNQQAPERRSPMSVRHRSAGGRTRLRAAVPILIIMCIASLSGAQIANADPPPAATALTAVQARGSGSAVGVTRHAESGGVLLELRLPAPRIVLDALPETEQGRRAASRFLDSAATGAVAIADGIGDPEAGILVSLPDGSQAHTALAGVAGAAFAPDGSWLAAVDAVGRLWRVDPQTGVASRLASGPYTGSIRFTRTGQLLLVEAASQDSPFPSVVVRFAPDARRAVPIDHVDGFIFSASELADASIAVTAHVFGGGVEVRRVTQGRTARLASLDPMAIDASLSDDGSRIAYAVAGAVYLHDVASGEARHLGPGEMPRMAHDGRSLIVLRDGQSILLAADGTELDRFPTATVGWASCAGRCRP
jgi:hypothetical protein